MGLKAPGLLTFLLSIILAMGVIFAHWFGAQLPFMNTDAHQFFGLLGAYVILLIGCIFRGL